MGKNPYEVLKVSPTAPQDEIRNAYRALAKKLHPDLNPGNKKAEAGFKEINAAYEAVGTPEARAKYDHGEQDAEAEARMRSERQRQPFYSETQPGSGRYSEAFNGMDEDFLSSLFGKRGARGSGGFDAQGADALYEMAVDFKDAVLGAEREITLPAGKKLRLKIPAGIESGAKLRFAGQGSPGVGKGAPGDVYVQVNITPSAFFKRSGSHLEIELPISVSEALLGSEVKAPTIDGAVLLKVPAGVSSGQRLRIPGKGVPELKGPGRGDQFVILKIIVPPKIDAEFKRAVEEWSKREPFDPRVNLGREGGV